MVSTRSARRKQEQEEKITGTENMPGTSSAMTPTSQSVRKSKSDNHSTSSSLARRKKLLTMKAAEEKARIKMELVDQKLALDLELLQVEGSCSSLSKEPSEVGERNDHVVEKWLESSHQQSTCQRVSQHATAAVDEVLGPAQLSTEPATAAGPQLLPVIHPALEAVRTPPPVVPYGGTDETVHALASALKNLTAATATGANGYNDRMLNRLCTPRDLPSYSGDPLQWLEFKQAYEESSQVCNFSDRENLWRLRRSLHGPAKDAVIALLIGATSPNEVMSTLELQFGNPDIIVSRILQDINKLRPMSQDYLKDIIPFSIKVKNCVAAVTAINCEHYLQGANVVSAVLSKLPRVLISKWTDYSFPFISQGTKPKLLVLSDFLSEEAVKVTKTIVGVQTYYKQNYSEYKSENRSRLQTLLVNNELSDSDNCTFCRVSKHPLPECKLFKKSLRKNRWNFVKRHGICFKCLKSQHKQDICSARACDVDNCGRSHHRLLHYIYVNKVSTPDNNNIDVTQTDMQKVETITNLHMSNKVLLKTVPICLHGPNGIVNSVALLDDGSTVTLISDKLTARLGLRGALQSMRVCGAWDNSEIVCNSEVVDLNISNSEGTMFPIRARCVKNMNLPVQNVTADDLDSYELNTPEIKNIISYKQCKPELLIGQDNYDLLLPLQIIKGTSNGPYLTRTPLGWCIHGCSPHRQSSFDAGAESTLFLSESQTRNMETEYILREMQEEMRQSFALDSVGASSKPRENIEDVRAREHLERTAKLIDGRWHVGLPWKDSCCGMPDSYPNAVIRLNGIEKKMKGNPEYAERYSERIHHLFSNDYASPIEDSPHPGKKWYLPHFGVDNPKKKKLRLVFDAAAKSRGMCLNDYILKGPDMLISLYGIMLRFRENKVAVTADIRDMFLRIKIIEADRHTLRFLWRPSPEQPIKTYIMSSLIFGANCSPFIAQFIKNKNAERYQSSMPEAEHAIRTQHYMDDYIDSLEDEQLAIKVVNDVTHIHKQGGFEIRNWTSNYSTLMNNLSNQHSRSAVSFNCNQTHDGERTLGIMWYPTDDTLGFDVTFKRIPAVILSGIKKPTKREMVKVLMSIFDICGFLSPINIKGKIMLQETWKSGISWDDEIPDTIFVKWLKWLNAIKDTSKIRLPRYYESAAREQPARVSGRQDLSASAPNSETPLNQTTDAGETGMRPSAATRYTNLQLHIFCDSSAKAMCAVAYWRWTDVNKKQIRVAFIGSKCRVAPVKYISMPRLELQAALIAGRLLDNIINEHRIKPVQRYIWCDSLTVLHWIRNNAKNYKAYIAHRLGEIDELTNVNEWRYIPTKLNVADIATRDLCTIDILQNEWFRGPNFLYENEDLWPRESDVQQLDIRDVDLECVNTLHIAPVHLPAVPDPVRFSSWLRLLRSTSVVLSFINKCKKNTYEDHTTMEHAETLLIKYSQMNSFPDDLYNLQNKINIDKKSKLLTLTPLLDDDGILRVGGRIDAAPGVSTDVKRPIILDGRCHIARLIVTHYHVKACHGNQEMVVNELKQRYWIIRLRPTVKNISSQCMFCRIRRVQPQPPRMGDLPEARMAHHQRPFTFTGVDLFGPMEVTVGRRREKRYGVIFTCLTVRAIHIEIVNHLTTDAFIMALRRMSSRRGWPRHLYSDNGTNLRGAATELKKCVQELDLMKLKEQVMSYSTATTWNFNPPASPHWGGAWERLIRNIKSALKVTLKERAPRDETLQTLMAEVEHMVNSRPLSHVAVEPHSQETLTPNHFLLGTSSNLPTLGVYGPTDTFLRKQWRISQMLADMFWKRWVVEVLPDMRPRTKWCEDRRPLEVGDLVLVVDPNLPRGVWPKGLITSVLPGPDGRIRVVEVKTKSGVMRRPATRIARIPTGSECCVSTGEGDVGDA